MKAIRSFTFSSLILALLASCLSAGMARAQEMRGKFTLPFDARWGQATLPAGNYAFTIDHSQSAAAIVVSGTKTNAMILAQGYKLKEMGASTLLLTKERGVNTVRELRLAELGVVLYFVPGHPHQTAAEEKEMAQILPVTPGAGR